MLADGVRVDALVGAVGAAVRPGDVVVDLGTGTGLLAVAAARAGACRVYAIESDAEVLEVARRVVVDNGVDDRVRLCHGRSTEVELPERADVVVAEIVGSFGLEEEITRYLDDARRRFLVPGGRVVPDAVRLMAAPTEQGSSLGVWARQVRDRHGIDLESVDGRTRHLSSDMWADPGDLLGPAGLVLHCDLTQPPPEPLQGRAVSVIGRDGSLSGWVGWFEMSSLGRLVLSTRPPSKLTSWSQVFLSVGEPIPVVAGGLAGLEVRFDAPYWTWAVETAGTRRSFSELEAWRPAVGVADGGEEAVPR